MSEFRAEKIEQRSLTLVWREPSYPNSSRTEYEIKYYEKVTPSPPSYTVTFQLSSYLVNSDTWKNSIALDFISNPLFRATALSCNGSFMRSPYSTPSHSLSIKLGHTLNSSLGPLLLLSRFSFRYIILPPHYLPPSHPTLGSTIHLSNPPCPLLMVSPQGLSLRLSVYLGVHFSLLSSLHTYDSVKEHAPPNPHLPHDDEQTGARAHTLARVLRHACKSWVLWLP